MMADNASLYVDNYTRCLFWSQGGLQAALEDRSAVSRGGVNTGLAAARSRRSAATRVILTTPYRLVLRKPSASQ